MDEDKYNQLKKDVDYLNAEGFVPEGKELRVFKNQQDLIQALRNNEVPGIEWDLECEKKYLDSLINNDNATE